LCVGMFLCGSLRAGGDAVLRPCEKILASLSTPKYAPKKGVSSADRLESAASWYDPLIDLHRNLLPKERIAARDRLIKTLEDDISYLPRSPFVTKALADSLTERVANHPVLGHRANPKYEMRCKGMCFSRALGIHIEALREGVGPTWIRKIWVVGNLGDSDFHVAVLIRTQSGWKVVDANGFVGPQGGFQYGTQSVSEWIRQQETSSPKREPLSFFVTDARRFGVYRPTLYSPTDLFGNGSREEDFYRGRFVDYFEGLSSAEQSSMVSH